MVRSLPAPFEFLIVVGVAFGGFIYVSLFEFVSGPITGAGSGSYWADEMLIALAVHEIVTLALLAVFLHIRGWVLSDIDMRMSWLLTGGGVLLAGGYYAIYYVAYPLFTAVAHQLSVGIGLDTVASTGAVPVEAALGLFAIVLVSVVNPVFEEVLVAGYVMTVVPRKNGIWLAINVSTLIRLSYHLYQGPVAGITIIPLGVLFGYVYARTGKLWPLIVAHAILDFVALYAMGG